MDRRDGRADATARDTGTTGTIKASGAIGNSNVSVRGTRNQTRRTRTDNNKHNLRREDLCACARNCKLLRMGRAPCTRIQPRANPKLYTRFRHCTHPCTNTLRRHKGLQPRRRSGGLKRSERRWGSRGASSRHLELFVQELLYQQPLQGLMGVWAFKQPLRHTWCQLICLEPLLVFKLWL